MPYKTAVKSIRMFLVCCDMDRLCSSTVLHVHCPYNDASLRPHAPAPPPPTGSQSLFNLFLSFFLFFLFFEYRQNRAHFSVLCIFPRYDFQCTEKFNKFQLSSYFLLYFLFSHTKKISPKKIITGAVMSPQSMALSSPTYTHTHARHNYHFKREGERDDLQMDKKGK